MAVLIERLKLASVIVCFLLGSGAFAQTKTNSQRLAGDNFDLHGALELFRKADTPENFEKAINAKGNDVNKLDLDGDGNADYVSVIDKKNSDVHTLVLQVTLSTSEIQNIAAIEVEKTGNDKMHVQMVGDETLYGKSDTITWESETEIVTSEATVTRVGRWESDDDVYSASDKSGSTSLDLQVIEPVVTKIGYGIGYFMVDIIGPVIKDALH
ncbi:MAG: hypothetical protein O9353_04495, partial [Bacteroidia bacterium]|nr:hypothetical protein [Bacteroidia bacterium]